MPFDSWGHESRRSNEVYNGGEDEILVTIGPIDNARLKQFMPGTKNGKILESLFDYLLPVHVDVTTHFELFGTEKSMRLADKDNDFNSTMGLSTYL